MRQRTRRHWRPVALGIAGLLAVPLVAAPDSAGADSNGAVTVSRSVSRVHLVGGADQVVEKRDVSATVSSTKALRDRETIAVTWTGAHPTGGLLPDVNSGGAAEQEYPFVILECRGRDDASLPVAQQVRPETCWTSTPLERYNASNFIFPPWRLDRAETPADRTSGPNQPNPLPAACADSIGSGANRWLPFDAADGTVYRGGGGSGCAGIPPEAVVVEGAVPSNQTYGQSDAKGNGSAKFVIQTADSNASLGCSDTVACSLVMIPIMGISCDVSAASLPAVDQPATYGASVVSSATSLCQKTGHYAPGELAAGLGQEDVSVSGSLWYSASNWDNRLSVPLSMAQSPNACSVLNTSAPVYVYGSESMIQTSLQWAPHFCLNSSLFKFQHVQVPEPQAKNLLNSGSVEAAFEAGPPDTAFSRPVAQAPVAYTGFAIATTIDDNTSHDIADIKLTPRLLAKLLTESYASNFNVLGDFASLPSSNPSHVLATNPVSMSRDPEFLALNPNARKDPAYYEAASTLYVMSSDSDVMSALTSYINADPEARAWLNGTADPWGMKVNPHYKGIALPVRNWPQLDTLVSKSEVEAGNTCLQYSPVPWLPLVAAPVTAMASITLNMQYGIANSQVRCVNPDGVNRKLASIGRQSPGTRFSLGLVSLGDATRYQIDTAALQTSVASSAPVTFTDDTGRTFVQPSDSSLKDAAALFKTDRATNTWRFDYAALKSNPTAYPGALLISMDVPTSGLSKTDASRYATLMRYAVGPGQTRGVLTGQLAPGFLPLTADNGLGDQAAFTLRAATTVQSQSGATPLVTGGQVAPPPPGPAPSTAPPSTGGTTTPPANGGPGSSAAPSAAPSSPPSSGPSAKPVAGGQTVPVGLTQGVQSGAVGVLLPLVLLLAVLCALIIPVTGLVERYRGRA